MENAVDALKISFAVFVLVVGLFMTFMLVSQAKAASDNLLHYADETNFYNYSISSDKNRIVGVAEVVSTLNKYNKESLSVTIVLKGKPPKTFDLTLSNGNLNQQKEELDKYITSILSYNENVQFLEEFVEVPLSGKYEYGEDGTILTTQSGINKIYIKYKQNE